MIGLSVTFFEYTLELEGPKIEIRLYKKRDDLTSEPPEPKPKVMKMMNRRIKK